MTNVIQKVKLHRELSKPKQQSQERVLVMFDKMLYFPNSANTKKSLEEFEMYIYRPHSTK